MFFIQDRLVFFLGGQHDAVGGLQADGGSTGRDGRQGVLYLDEFAGRADAK